MASDYRSRVEMILPYWESQIENCGGLQGTRWPPTRGFPASKVWAPVRPSNVLHSIQVMILGRWADIETMMIYARMAGVETVVATASATDSVRSLPLESGRERDLALHGGD